VFEGDKGKKYAAVIARIVENVQGGLEEISAAGSAPGEEPSDTVCEPRKMNKNCLFF
jgi:dynein light chain roadblock-type